MTEQEKIDAAYAKSLGYSTETINDDSNLESKYSEKTKAYMDYVNQYK